MNEKDEKREQLEAELRELHSKLDASSSSVGDWNISKVVEDLLECVITKSTVEEAVEKWKNRTMDKYGDKLVDRQQIRNRINAIEEELSKE